MKKIIRNSALIALLFIGFCFIAQGTPETTSMPEKGTEHMVPGEPGKHGDFNFDHFKHDKERMGSRKHGEIRWGTSDLKVLPDPNFIGLPTLGKWDPYGGQYGGPTIAKQGTLCIAQGLIRNGDWKAELALLPEGYRPQKINIFGVNNHNRSARLDATPNGELRWQGGGGDHGWISLSGVVYSPTQFGSKIELNSSDWVEHGGDTFAPAYIKEGNIIALQGIARIKTSWDAVRTGDGYAQDFNGSRLIGTLPEGACPTKHLIFCCMNNGIPCRIAVLPNGKIGYVSGGGDTSKDNMWISLSGITFSTIEGKELECINGWAPYQAKAIFGAPTAIKHGNICVLQGLIQAPTKDQPNWANIARLPKELWPSKQLIFNTLAYNAANSTDTTARVDITVDGHVTWGGTVPQTGWVSLNNIVYALPEQQLGGKNYTHIERVVGDGPAFHENWKFGMPGNGWVKFKAKAEQDVCIWLSSVPAPLTGATYLITFGGYDNTRLFVRKVGSDVNLYEIDILKGGNPDAVVTDGRPRDGILKLKDGKPESGQTFYDYWIKFENDTLSFGKGTEVGKNEVGKWTDPEPLKFVQYVGFHGWNQAVYYKDIQLSGAPIIEVPINLPEGFDREDGKYKRVSCGSRNGELEGWALGFDNQLYRYDPYSMTANPWIKQEFKDKDGKLMLFEDVSCSSDGTLAALLFDAKQNIGLIYNWETKAWTPLDPGKESEALDFEFISAGTKDCILGIDADNKDLYLHTKDGWKIIADNVAMYAAAGVDGTIVALNEAGEAFNYKDDKWVEMSGVKLERVAVGSKDLIIGSTDKNNELWQWKDGKWEHMKGKGDRPANGLDEISINAAGTIFATDEDGDPYNKGEAGVALSKPTATAIKAEKAKAVAEGKAEPTTEAIENKLTTAAPTEPKKAETRATAKKTGKVAKKAVKTKTTGKGKVEKAVAKVDKKAENVDKIVKKTTKKAATKKRTSAKKTAPMGTKKTPAAKKTTTTTVKPAAKKPAAKKPATKKPAAKKPAAKKPTPKSAAEKKTT